MAIEITDVTNGSGTGYFDLLMVSINDQLTTQFQEQRLTGTDYANVYLGAMQVTLQQAMNFALTKELTEQQIIDITSGISIKLAQEQQIQSQIEIAEEQSAADLTLKEANELNTENNTLIASAQSTQDLLNKAAQAALLTQQELTESQNTLVVTEKAESAALYESSTRLAEQTKIEEEVDLLQSQDLDVIAGTVIKQAQSAADISLKEAQELNVESDTSIKETQSTQDQALKQAQEILVEKQTLTEQANTDLVIQNEANALSQNAQIVNQALKIIEETNLLEQKGITEWAETELVAKTPGSVSGLKGEQGALYHTQANGFKHKAANDALSALMNMWSVAESQDGLMVQPNAATTTTEGRLINMAFEVYNNANAETPTYDTP